MQKLILGIFGSLFLFTGCANKDLATHYLKEGNITKAYNIYKKWKETGHKNYVLNISNIELNETQKFELANDAFNHNIKYGANILENIYYKKGDFKKARYYYERSDLNNSTQQDFYTHLAVISTFDTLNRQKEELEKIETIAENNIYAKQALGKFYEDKNNYFYDIDKSFYFYKEAYKKGYLQSGINLAKIYLYNLNEEKKGEELLKKIASTAPKAAYILAKYFMSKLDKKIIELNTPCITCNFKKPYDFFYKKYYLIKYRDAFIKNRIVPLLDYAYKKGYIEAKFLSIRLDLKYNKFLSKSNYSNLTLTQAIAFLNNYSNKFLKAKILLADIYSKYKFLNKYKLAKNIYLEYANSDKINAYWYLYQYYKKYEPNSSKKIEYLNYLVKNKFIPAIIEKAYLNKNVSILYRYYKKDNFLAIKYYLFLMRNRISLSKKCYLYNKLCKYTPFDKKTDLKIAKLYEKKRDYVKAATIYKFYSDFNDSIALYKLSLIYKKLCNFDKYVSFLKNAQKKGDEKLKLIYASEVVKGKIRDDEKKEFEYIKSLAHKNNGFALSILGNLYATGIYVEFTPEKAEFYYKKSIKMGFYNSIYSLINLYEKINLTHKYDKKIEKLYKLAIKHNLPRAYVNLAQFYISIKRYKKAIAILKRDLIEPKAKYLLYKITGKFHYLNSAAKTNYGGLLLEYAKKIAKHNPYKALLYSFRASRCNTNGAVLFSYEMMKRVNNVNVIKRIYQKAKSYPKCENY